MRHIGVNGFIWKDITMKRNEKVTEVENLKSRFQKTQVAILADYRGLSVSDLTDLRGRLRKSESSFKVVKNRLAKIAIKDTDYQVLDEHFKGTVSLTTSATDPVGPAKVLTEFAKENEKLKILIGAMDGKALSAKEVAQLASMPSREELLAKLVGSMQAPIQNMANVLAQTIRQVLNVLNAVKEQKEKTA